MAQIILEHITYRYREHLPPALDDVSVSFQPGERVCIIGANGSGKTTLVRYLAGLLPHQSTNGHNPEIAFLFQNPDNQMVAATVDKELAFGLENIAMPPREIEQRIDREAAQFSIISLLRRLTTELSGGEKQRVALASVLISRPSILLLDEPDAFLDQPGRVILKSELERIRVQHPSLIEVRIAQSATVAKNYPRVILMAEGRIVADGPPDAVLQKIGISASVAPESAKSHEELPEASSSISLKGVAVTLSGHQVLSDIELTLTAGRTLGIVGATGSGKSTLGNVLVGLVKPSSGKVVVHTALSGVGAEITRPSLITAVLQQPERQFFLPTCKDEIEFGPRNLGRPLADNAVRPLLRLVGLDAAIHGLRDPLTLSAGEKRRLAFAVALAMGTSFIVFDEPTAGLDLEGVASFVALSRRLKNEGRGQVLITHEAGIVRALADDVLVLRGGTGQFFTRADFFAQYPWQNLLSQELSLP